MRFPASLLGEMMMVMVYGLGGLWEGSSLYMLPECGCLMGQCVSPSDCVCTGFTEHRGASPYIAHTNWKTLTICICASSSCRWCIWFRAEMICRILRCTGRRCVCVCVRMVPDGDGVSVLWFMEDVRHLCARRSPGKVNLMLLIFQPQRQCSCSISLCILKSSIYSIVALLHDVRLIYTTNKPLPSKVEPPTKYRPSFSRTPTLSNTYFLNPPKPLGNLHMLQGWNFFHICTHINAIYPLWQ